MPNYFKQVAVAVLAVAICISGIACGGDSNPHPCQGATCAPSASEFLYATALDDISGFSIATGGSPTSLQNQAGPNQSIGIVVGPSAKFLYVSDFENAGVEAF